MQLAPSPELADLVKHYLIIDHQVESVFTHRFFPDGHAGLVFSYADSLTRSDDRTLPATHLDSFMYGQVNRYHNLSTGKNIGLLIVVLQPWGLSLLSGIPADETTNQQLSFGDVFGKAGIYLQDSVLGCVNTISRIKKIESFLLSLRQRLSGESVLIKAAAELISSTNGAIPIQQLTQQLTITERSLERRFNKIIGIGPKQFARILRLQNCLKIHRQNPLLNLTQLAYTAGYYDQAHFIREFSHFVGITPKQYEANTKRLAVNLMPLPL